MNRSEPALPKHIYIEPTGSDGTTSRFTFAPDKLLAWSEGGRGDAIDKWCKQVYGKKIEEINAWEDNQIIYLEDEWASAENDVEEEEEDEDEEEIRFHLACEAVTREAQMKRELAKQQMAEHKEAIEKLVRQAKAVNMAPPTPTPQERHLVRYLIAVGIGFGIGITAAYLLFS